MNKDFINQINKNAEKLIEYSNQLKKQSTPDLDFTRSTRLLEFLGLDKNIKDSKEIKKAYLKFSRIMHPDKNLNNQKATENFQKLKKVYEFLNDENRLDAYKKYLETPIAKEIKKSQEFLDNFFLNENEIKLNAEKKKNIILNQEPIDFSINKIDKVFSEKNNNLEFSSYIITFTNKESSKNFESLINEINKINGQTMIRAGTSAEKKNSLEITITRDNSINQTSVPNTIKENLKIINEIGKNSSSLDKDKSFIQKFEKIFEDTIRKQRNDKNHFSSQER